MISCSSDELTERKIESLFTECYEDIAIEQQIGILHGSILISRSGIKKSKRDYKYYQKIDSSGMIEISAKKTIRLFLEPYDSFTGELTSKGKESVISSDTISKGKFLSKVRFCDYKFVDVKEIQEIPQKNEAKVKIKLKRTNETGFFTELDEQRFPKEFLKSFDFRKTTDGWKLCD